MNAEMLDRSPVKTFLRWAIFCTFAACSNSAAYSSPVPTSWPTAPNPPDYSQSAEAIATPQPVGPGAQPQSVPQADPLASLIRDKDYSGSIRPIGQLQIDIRPRDLRGGSKSGELPADESKRVLQRQALALTGQNNRAWCTSSFFLEASQLCHQPLYFEETNLVRYGYSQKGLRLVQPAVSCVRFFLTVPALPYLMSAHPPRERIYTLGEYPIGSPVPYQRIRPPYTTLGGIVEAGVWVGLIALIP